MHNQGRGLELGLRLYVTEWTFLNSPLRYVSAGRAYSCLATPLLGLRWIGQGLRIS
jgi:hypothetical protein